MNTPNTTAPSRIEIGEGWTLTYDSDGCTFRNEAANLSVGVGTKHSRSLFDVIAAMNRPAPQQVPVRSAEVQKALDWINFFMKGAVSYSDECALKVVLAYIAILEAHSPVNTAQPAGSEWEQQTQVAYQLGQFIRCTSMTPQQRKRLLEIARLAGNTNPDSDFPKVVIEAALTQPVNTGTSAKDVVGNMNRAYVDQLAENERLRVAGEEALAALHGAKAVLGDVANISHAISLLQASLSREVA